jgi:molybdopterin/thiamine biosynthesis adenylyltransferase
MGRRSVSAAPTSPESDVRRLIDEGYSVALVGGMLTVANVPYVGPTGDLGRGELVVPLSMTGGRLAPPNVHTAWWYGDEPCETDGTTLKGVNVTELTQMPLPERGPARMICGKPHGREFRDHHEFVVTYITLLGGPAAAIDPLVTARVQARQAPVDVTNGDFAYLDTATPRSALGSFNEKIRGQIIGIIGLGGTGSYVLDLISKCCVRAIHLFDDDLFEQHSAFRAPGAATIDDLRARRRKVDHFASMYRGIHRGVVPHAVRIDAGTAPLLDMLDFAFVCIDDAAAKPPIMERLAARGIPYVDVGMGLHASDRGIVGAMRTTLVTPDDDTMIDRIPIVGDPDGIYSTNIQICELNALNAAFAVIAWKQHHGFYAANRGIGNGVFVVEDGIVHNEERT